MKVKIEIRMDSAAFDDGANEEFARILSKIAAIAASGATIEVGDGYPLFDINGNRVGKVEVRE